MSARLPRLAVVGAGNVGGAALRQLAALGSRSPVATVAIADASGIVASDGFSPAELSSAAKSGIAALGAPIANDGPAALDAALVGARPDVIIDLTAAPFGRLHLAWLARGWGVATANKKPVCGPQEEFDALAARGQAYGFECACGAALPVVDALRGMMATGDKPISVRAMPSGTLGFILSACGKGTPFADAVAEARRLGYTEPDPRDDLSGADVARKALILARLAGHRLELADIAVRSLVPPELVDADVGSFMRDLSLHAGTFDAWSRDAAARGKAIRYLAEVTAEGVRVGPAEVGPDDPFFVLSGPENMFVFRTARYDAVPMIVRGPGAGADVTAAGVLAEAFEIAERVHSFAGRIAERRTSIL